MRPRTIVMMSTASLATLAAAVWTFSPPALLVDVAPITRGAFLQTIDDDGITRVRDRYIITSPVSGSLLRPGVKAGDEVKPDQVVATIIPSTPQLLDPRTRSELVARREAADARALRAKALVLQAEAAFRQAELDLRRLRELSNGNYVSKTQIDQGTLSVELRKKDLEAARYESDASFHDLEQSRAALARLTGTRKDSSDSAAAWEVRSPVAGKVLSVVLESGGPIAVGSAILEIGDVSRLEAVIDVLSNDATKIASGAGVELTAGDGVVLYGQVRHVEPAARTKISALGVEEQRVDVIVDMLPNRQAVNRVGDGYRVDARIAVSHSDNAVQVPTAALFRDGQNWAVFAVMDGRAVKQVVEIGPRNSEYAMLTRGPPAGTPVVVYPSDVLEDGRRLDFSTSPSE